jgi:hydroxyacylglutathione hydrolase
VAGTLPAARAVPLARLVGSLDEFDPEAPTVVYCAGGYRSLVASSVLRHAGFADVSDLLGGYGAWAAAGLPVVTGTKQPGDII